MVGAIYGSTRKEPTVVGKPAEFMLDNIAKTFALKRDQICMARSIAPPPPAALRCRRGQAGRRCAAARTPAQALHTSRCAGAHAPAALPQPLSLRPQVGDRLDTDVLFGKNGGLTTCLVLSGVTTEAQLLSPDNKIHPDYFMAELPELLSVKASVKAPAAARA